MQGTGTWRPPDRSTGAGGSAGASLAPTPLCYNARPLERMHDRRFLSQAVRGAPAGRRCRWSGPAVRSRAHIIEIQSRGIHR
jgi:hypothetical protein